MVHIPCNTAKFKKVVSEKVWNFLFAQVAKAKNAQPSPETRVHFAFLHSLIRAFVE